MRWYCVHPGLPQQAELRVRASPDNSAAERARVSHGRAIAACSPIFQVAGDAADDAPISWLHVAYQDAASGETEGGFMMASLPDGTPLVTPWETTNFCGCCEVTDPAALLFDGPQATARSLGAVQSVNLLYCIVEEREGKLRIFHPTIQSAWIDMKDVRVVCVRLKHDSCSTLHTFYELNETLPEEAQIAIREFPSKEAQTVGLLSRGETLEVTVRGGNWLQIAGGTVDKAWIMWRTDALELLQEAPDVCSGNCTTRTDTAVTDIGVLDQGGCVGNQTELPSPHEVPEETTGGVASALNCEIDAAPEVNAVAVAVASITADEVSAGASEPPPTKCVDDTTKTAEINDPCQDGALIDVTMREATASEDRPVRTGAALLNGVDKADSSTADLAPVVDDSTVADDKNMTAEAVAGGKVEEASPMQTEESWDDRPIRPAPTAFDVCGGASGERQNAPAWDDRPIRPAPAVPDDVSSGDDEASDVEAEVDDGSVAEDKDTAADVVAGGENEEASPMQTEESLDDRPIRPAPTAFDVSGGVSGERQNAPAWDDRPIRPAPAVPDDVSSSDDEAADVEAEVDDGSVAEDKNTVADVVAGGENEETSPMQTEESWDDRPIRPAPTAFDVCGGASGERQNAPAWDDRPIRPAPAVPDDVSSGDDEASDVEAEVDDGSVAEDKDTAADVVAGGENEEASPMQTEESLDDRPIRPAPTAFDVSGGVSGERQNAPAWDDRPIRPAPAVPDDVSSSDDEAADVEAEVDDGSVAEDKNTVADVVAGGENEETSPMQTEESWDDRPIRPAPTAFDVSGGVSGERQNAPAWDDRPIRPAPAVPDDVSSSDDEAADVEAEVDDGSVAEDKNTVADVVAGGENEETSPMQTEESWDDRPIRPAPTAFDVCGGASGERQNAPAWDDRPIRPAPAVPDDVSSGDDEASDVEAEVDDGSVAEDKDTAADVVAGGENEEASPMQTEESLDDRPIRPAPTAFDVSGGVSGERQNAPAWDDRPIRPAPAVPDDVSSSDDEAADVEAEVDDGSVAEDKNTVADVVAGGENEETSPMQTEESWDDRPIRPAPTAFDVSGGVSGERQNAPAWDDRPIRPVHIMAKGGEIVGVEAGAAAEINAAANDVDDVLVAANGVEPTQSSSVWEDRPIRSVRTRQDEDGNGASSDYSSATTRDETKMCASRPIESQDGTAKEILSVIGSASIESPGARRMQPGHFSQQVNPFERRYAESETTSGSESGEIALLGGLEDVFDPVDELLPAMAEDIVQEIDDGITGVLSAAVSEPVPLGAAGVGENLDDANRSAQEKTPFGDSSPSDGLSYLQHFGIGKYCEHKQSLITPSDELAQAMYEANQDDSDLVFQALVGDEPLSDDWFHDVSLRDLHAGPHLRAVPKTTYDLIMANASPEDILEAELLDDDEGDFDLVMSFKYPVPKRRALEPSRSPSLFRRVPSAPTGMSVLETKAAISPAIPPSESDLNADGSPPGSRQPSPASRRTSVSARTSPVPAKSTTPPRSPLPRQPVGPPSTPVPPAGSRLMQRKSIATPSSIGKPPNSLMRPRSFVQPSHLAAPASPALSKPVASGLTPPSRASGSCISAASTPSIATPTRSLLQRRSMLSAPSPAKTIGTLSTIRSSITGSIPKPTEVSSGLQAPRKSFDFRRPFGLSKKT